MSEQNLDQRIAGLHAATGNIPAEQQGPILAAIEAYDPELRADLGRRLGATMTLLMEHEHFATPTEREMLF